MRITTSLGDLYVEVIAPRVANRTRVNKPPVTLWHSFLHHGGMWQSVVPALADSGRQVIVVDGPGHGRSTPIRRPFNMAECGSAWLQVLDGLGIERASILGLSWGGMAAMELAVAAPTRVAQLGLFDTSGRVEPRFNRLKYALLSKIFTSVGPTPGLLDRIEPLLFGPRAQEFQQDEIQSWRGYVRRLDRPSIEMALECIMGRRAILPLIRKLVHVPPTLVVIGEWDVAQPLVESQAITQATGGQLYIVPGAGHLSALEQPAAVNARLVSFLDETNPAL